MGSENQDKIRYGKIILNTLLKMLAMATVIFILNSWPQIRQSFNGETPELAYWLDHSFKPSNLLLIAGFGIYFFYRDVKTQQEAINKASDQED